MSFQPDLDHLITLYFPGIIGEALGIDEIVDGMRETGLTEDELRELASVNAKDLVASAAASSSLEEWLGTVLIEGVVPLFRRVINERLQPLLWNTVRVTEAPGLRRVRERRFVVDTSSVERFAKVVNQVPSGAIGVAGPRGVGKTTLLDHYVSQLDAPFSVSVAAPVQYEARDFVLHLYAELCQSVIDRFGRYEKYARRWFSAVRFLLYFAITVVADRFVLGLAFGWPDMLRDPFSLRFPPLSQGNVWLAPAFAVLAVSGCALFMLYLAVIRVSFPARQHPLALRAEEELRHIKFLQTRTVGWSGKLTLPANAEAGWTSSTQNAERPWTYPEIIKQLREFLRRIAREGFGDPGVIVTIDELDKIESAEQAQQFHNEIKGVFGVERTQFLVSISEDALAAFERRGLPIRDAFDSAFDEVVRIGHLTLADSSLLLNSRVIGLPEPFLCLVHCLSGGLPRDVIRTARAVVAASEEERRPIDEVCAELVAEDIERKAHAFQIAAAKWPGTETTEFIRALRGLRADPDVLLALRPEPAADADLDLLRAQATAYSYHCATVLQVFTRELTKDQLDAKRGALDLLAGARQELAGHPQLSRLMLSEFRDGCGLAVT